MRNLFLIGILVAILSVGVIASSYISVPIYNSVNMNLSAQELLSDEIIPSLQVTAIQFEEDGDYPENRHRIQIEVFVYDENRVYERYPIIADIDMNIHVWGASSGTYSYHGHSRLYSERKMYLTDEFGKLTLWARSGTGERGIISFNVGGIEHRVHLGDS